PADGGRGVEEGGRAGRCIRCRLLGPAVRGLRTARAGARRAAERGAGAGRPRGGRERSPGAPGPEPRDRDRTSLRRHPDPHPPRMSKSIAVCPGSYDPITYGHVDIISRAAAIFDEVVVAVVNVSTRKSRPLFEIDERMAFIAEATAELGNVRAEPFDILV